MCHNVTNASKDMIFLVLKPEVKVTVIKDSTRHSVTPRCIHTPNLRFVPQIILKVYSGHTFSRIEARGQSQGHSVLKIVCDTSGPQGVS